MGNKLRQTVAAFIAAELPVLIFIFCLFQISAQFHSRKYLMLDYALTFDHWWYFYHRLQEGALAQWNPFSLFGKVAVQWNYVPVSILTPFLYFLKFDLAVFHNAQILGTFLSLTGLYFSCRILGYGRLISMVPSIVLAMSGYRYWIALPHTATFLFLYPMAFAFILKTAKSPQRGYLKWAFPVLLTSLAFLGTRLEPIVHFVFFATSLSVFLGIENRWSGKQYGVFVGGGLLALAAILGVNAWHLVFLFQATAENSRMGGFYLTEVFSSSIYRWMGISIVYQPLLLMVLVNGGLKWMRTRAVRCAEESACTTRQILVLIFFQAAAFAAMVFIHYLLNENAFIDQSLANKRAIVHDYYRIFAIPVVMSLYWMLYRYREGHRPTLSQGLGGCALFFAAVYVTQYSWQLWPVNRNMHYFFMPPWLNWLMPLGVLALVSKWGKWPVRGLILFHLIGETGCFPLFEWFGFPWNASRATILELPLQAIFVMETAAAIVGLSSYAVRNIKLPRENVSRKFQLSAARVFSVLQSMAALKVFSSLLWLSLRAIRKIRLPEKLDLGRYRLFAACLFSLLCALLLRNALMPQIQRVDPEQITALMSADHFSSVHLEPQLYGENWVVRDFIVPEAWRGKNVKVVSYAKSKNKSPYAIFMVAGDNIATANITYYPNTGLTEKLEVVMKLPENAKSLSARLGMHTAASAGVDFEKLQVFGEGPKSPNLIDYYAEQFPFSETRVHEYGIGRTSWVDNAYEYSLEMGRKNSGKSGLNRVFIEDDILRCDSQQYRFMPAVSGTRNTAPVYSSEIPYNLKLMYVGPEKARSRSKPHPEMSPLVVAKKEYSVYLSGGEDPDIYDYLNQVLLWTHADPLAPARLLTAEEGTGESRVLIKPGLKIYASEADEFSALKNEIAKNGRLPDFVTTTDTSVRQTAPKDSAVPLRSSFELIKDDPEKIQISTMTNMSAYLVLLDLFSKGWTAKLNGKSVDVHRGYLGVRFIQLPAGKNLVEFVYQLPGLTFCLWTSLASFCVLIFLCILSLPRHKSETHTTPGVS